MQNLHYKGHHKAFYSAILLFWLITRPRLAQTQSNLVPPAAFVKFIVGSVVMCVPAFNVTTLAELHAPAFSPVCECYVSGSWTDLNSHVSWGSGKPTSSCLCPSFCQSGNPALCFSLSVRLIQTISCFMTHWGKTWRQIFRDSLNRLLSCTYLSVFWEMSLFDRLRRNLEYFSLSDHRSFTCQPMKNVTWEVWYRHRDPPRPLQCEIFLKQKCKLIWLHRNFLWGNLRI